MKKMIILAITHLLAAIIGFGLGIYLLPILIAPPAPDVAEVQAASVNSMFTADFVRDLKDSDTLHWGEGKVSIGPKIISLQGEIAPGPDYKLYLSPEFVETEVDFKRLKESMVRVADVKTFENFIINVPESIDPTQFNTIIIWCETFGQFITSAKYR